MSHCVVCNEEFSWSPMAKHFYEYVCGACGGLVGSGCLEQVITAKGFGAILCRNCASQKAPANLEPKAEKPVGKTPDPAADTMVNRAFAGVPERIRYEMLVAIEEGERRLNEQREALIRDANMWQEDLFKRGNTFIDARLAQFQKAVKEMVEEEFRVALKLALLMGGLVFVTGLISLAFAYLHRHLLGQ